jgi:hypothetical protein
MQGEKGGLTPLNEAIQCVSLEAHDNTSNGHSCISALKDKPYLVNSAV